MVFMAYVHNNDPIEYRSIQMHAKKKYIQQTVSMVMLLVCAVDLIIVSFFLSSLITGINLLIAKGWKKIDCMEKTKLNSIFFFHN